jgi:hypothetical protein
MGVQAGTVSGPVVAGAGTRDWRPQFRLRPGQDDALIVWLCSMAPRRRSQAIREALHHYVASRQEPACGGWDEDPDLAAALDSLF